MKTLRYILLTFGICLSVCAVAAAQNKSGAKTSLDYLQEGSVFYMEGRFKQAIEPYQKALDLEKKEPALEKNLWRVLVDNLGISYGITGDLKKAKETFEYGLSKDPTYPMFHYNMACTYAEMDDRDNAIASLKTAFEHRENMIQGERMPDPAKDSSFARFMKDEKFLRALKEIKQK
jgi:tetratricopeptide (TPR) repeat protein